jgi:hypothetical protein
MPDTREPAIIINGQTLNESQAMTVRVAIGFFQSSLSELAPLGNDEHGHAITKAYRRCLNEVTRMMMMRLQP